MHSLACQLASQPATQPASMRKPGSKKRKPPSIVAYLAENKLRDRREKNCEWHGMGPFHMDLRMFYKAICI